MSILLPENRYSIRLNQVLSFAHANVSKNIQLDDLAGAACLSKYHFSRIFQDQLGESPGRFLKRIRLERAACLLSNLRTLPIVDIGSKCGFSSIQLFSRTFGDHFGYCPRQFRSNHIFSMEHRRGRKNIEMLYKKFRTIGIYRDSPSSYPEIEVVKLPSTNLAYVRSFGKYHCGSGEDAINSLETWARINRLWTPDTEIIGVTWDYSSITPDEVCRFDACIAIPNNFSPKTAISLQTIPVGHYAVIQVSYKPGENQKLFWKWFFLSLYTSPVFRNHAAQISSGPWLEIYKSKMRQGKYVAEFYVFLHD